MDLKQCLPLVKDYLAKSDLSAVPGWRPGVETRVTPLAQGEYNLNYLILQGQKRWVFRVNVGTQIARDDQISYEYRALKLLEGSGVTPRAFYVDDSRTGLPAGVLVMEYVPGEPLVYERDYRAAAEVFARIHTHKVEPAQNHLIREERPLSMTFDECTRMAGVYLNSELGDAAVKDFLSETLLWAGEARRQEAFFLSDPWPCIINTEVNSGNFIADRRQGALKLVDWEKPLWGDPSQDLSHFCVPTTTLWKTDFRFSAEKRKEFLSVYRSLLLDTHLKDTIEERVRLRDPFNCLRGVCWSAMAWVLYQTGEHAVRNADTFRKIERYLEMEFLTTLFGVYIR